jgi:hypothetical protein
VLQRIEVVQRTTAATTPVIIGVGRKIPSNHTIQALENTESVMIHSLHPKSSLFTTLPNINLSLLSPELIYLTSVKIVLFFSAAAPWHALSSNLAKSAVSGHAQYI